MPIKNKMSMGYFLFIAGLLLLLKPLSAFKIIPLRYETIKKISCVAWSSDSRYLAASSDDHTFTVWDTETGVLLSWFKHRKESEKYLIDDTVALMFLEQGFFLAVYSCSNLLTVYSIRTGRIAFEQEGVPWPAFLGAQHPIKNIRLQISEHKNLSYDLFIKDKFLILLLSFVYCVIFYLSTYLSYDIIINHLLRKIHPPMGHWHRICKH